jgi:hypothetical protein
VSEHGTGSCRRVSARRAHIRPENAQSGRGEEGFELRRGRVEWHGSNGEQRSLQAGEETSMLNPGIIERQGRQGCPQVGRGRKRIAGGAEYWIRPGQTRLNTMVRPITTLPQRDRKPHLQQRHPFSLSQRADHNCSSIAQIYHDLFHRLHHDFSTDCIMTFRPTAS